MTWLEAIKAFLLSLPGLVRIAEWWHNRYARAKDEAEDAAKQEEKQNDVASMDPDRVGPRLRAALRKRMRKNDG